MSTVELWYIDTTVNNHNSQAYIKMISDMRNMGNGVFNCTFKMDNSMICDYVVIESESYADTAPTKTNKVA